MKVRRPKLDKSQIPLRDVVSDYLQHHDGLSHSPATTRWYADILFAPNCFLSDEAVRDVEASDHHGQRFVWTTSSDPVWPTTSTTVRDARR